MVILEANPIVITTPQMEAASTSSLREERRRTGRYAAIGTAIFLTLLGCYVALDKGTWPYAALFVSALIMFVYVFWILYASNRARKLRRLREMQLLEVSSRERLDLDDDEEEGVETEGLAKKSKETTTTNNLGGGGKGKKTHSKNHRHHRHHHTHHNNCCSNQHHDNEINNIDESYNNKQTTMTTISTTTQQVTNENKNENKDGNELERIQLQHKRECFYVNRSYSIA